MPVEIHATSDALELEHFFGTVAALALPAAQESMMAAGELIVEEIKNSISTDGGGQPSPAGGPPYKQSGAYYDSWGPPVPFYGPGQAGCILGTDAPQGRRLELGFNGTDSLERLVHQAPRPHVGPACDKVEPLLAEDLIDKLVTYGPAR